MEQKKLEPVAAEAEEDVAKADANDGNGCLSGALPVEPDRNKQSLSSNSLKPKHTRIHH